MESLLVVQNLLLEFGNPFFNKGEHPIQEFRVREVDTKMSAEQNHRFLREPGLHQPHELFLRVRIGLETLVNCEGEYPGK